MSKEDLVKIATQIAECPEKDNYPQTTQKQLILKASSLLKKSFELFGYGELNSYFDLDWELISKSQENLKLRHCIELNDIPKKFPKSLYSLPIIEENKLDMSNAIPVLITAANEFLDKVGETS